MSMHLKCKMTSTNNLSMNMSDQKMFKDTFIEFIQGYTDAVQDPLDLWRACWLTSNEFLTQEPDSMDWGLVKKKMIAIVDQADDRELITEKVKKLINDTIAKKRYTHMQQNDQECMRNSLIEFVKEYYESVEIPEDLWSIVFRTSMEKLE